MGKIQAMASQILCGRCGAVLDHPNATCRQCGATTHGGPREGGAGTGYQQAPPQWARQWQARGRKEPWLAAFLSAIIPGLGQVYVGETWRGVAYFVGTVGLEFFGFDLDLTAIGLAVGVPLELGGAALWLHGIFDAYRRARSLNR